MSYEYSGASGRFEIPNPYRIENVGKFICGAIAGIAGLVLLITHREATGSGEVAGIKAIVVGIVLFIVALVSIGSALMQLRYYFGRGRPNNLYGAREGASSRGADALKENLRQNALVYREPGGAIDNLLHHIFDTLIFAPEQIRRAAEAQSFNLLLTVAILLGMMAGYLFYPDPAVRSWIAVGFLAVLIPKLLRPFAKQENIYRQSKAGIGFVVLIIALPIVGPPLLARIAPVLPDISKLEVGRTLWVSLGILVLAQALFFLALLRQLRDRPSINMACEQRAPSMNGNPAKLFEELERTLQSRWTETIPNRKYAHKKLPDIFSGQSGSFDGEVLEETQPLPTSGENMTIGEQLSTSANQFVAALSGLALVTFIGAVASAWLVAQAPIDAPYLGATAFLSIVLFLASMHCGRSAHLLWGRVDFTSLLMWVEVRGSFEESHLNIGNQMTSAMSSQKKVINVESMTLRVWAAELDTVVFDKNGYRDLIGMRGRPDITQFYADHLEGFAGRVASVVAPSTSTDVERIARIAQVQQMLGPPVTTPIIASPTQAMQIAAAQAAAAAAQNPAAMLAPRRCPNESCGRETVPGAAFCGFCGTKLAAAPPSAQPSAHA